MPLRFTRLDRPSIRRLKPGERVTEHDITAERLQNGDTRFDAKQITDTRS